MLEKYIILEKGMPLYDIESEYPDSKILQFDSFKEAQGFMKRLKRYKPDKFKIILYTEYLSLTNAFGINKC